MTTQAITNQEIQSFRESRYKHKLLRVIIVNALESNTESQWLIQRAEEKGYERSHILWQLAEIDKLVKVRLPHYKRNERHLFFKNLRETLKIADWPSR